MGQNGVLAGMHAKVVRQPFGGAASAAIANGPQLESGPPQAMAYRVAWLVSTVQVLSLTARAAGLLKAAASCH